jgi:hypothetical protein
VVVFWTPLLFEKVVPVLAFAFLLFALCAPFVRKYMAENRRRKARLADPAVQRARQLRAEKVTASLEH